MGSMLKVMSHCFVLVRHRLMPPAVDTGLLTFQEPDILPMTFDALPMTYDLLPMTFDILIMTSDLFPMIFDILLMIFDLLPITLILDRVSSPTKGFTKL